MSSVSQSKERVLFTGWFSFLIVSLFCLLAVVGGDVVSFNHNTFELMNHERKKTIKKDRIYIIIFPTITSPTLVSLRPVALNLSVEFSVFSIDTHTTQHNNETSLLLSVQAFDRAPKTLH